MSEVQHTQQSYQNTIHNSHTASATSSNINSTSSTPSSDSLKQRSYSDSNDSSSSTPALPPLQTSQSKIGATNNDGSNPPHPNAKTTTHVNANGATTTKTNILTPVCKNCQTSTTPLWRRDESGQVLCNACGLFLKLHGRPRPISLKTDVIKSRNRVKNSHHQSHTPSSTTSTPSSTSNKTISEKSTENKPNKDVKKSISSKELDFKHHQLSSPQSHSQAQNTNQIDSKDLSSSNNQTSPSLVPLLPRNNGTTSAKHTPNFFPQFHHLPPHLQHQVPLHHPSSVPTQFAPNLQAVTSPLLLSTTVKGQVQHHQLSQTQAAAGALETLSQDRSMDIDLDKSSLAPLNKEDNKVKPFSPSTALNNNSPNVNKLPSILNPPNSSSSNFYSSPSFGPQHSLTNPSAFSLLNPSSPQPQRSNSNPIASQNLNSNGSLNETLTDGAEVVKLKTRISELELVNDLYKSRIQELENLDSVGRQREIELRKKIEELENESQRKRIKLETE